MPGKEIHPFFIEFLELRDHLVPPNLTLHFMSLKEVAEKNLGQSTCQDHHRLEGKLQQALRGETAYILSMFTDLGEWRRKISGGLRTLFLVVALGTGFKFGAQGRQQGF